MQLTYLIVCLLTTPAFISGESLGHVTRDYFGDIFTLGDCQPGSCDSEGRRAAQIPGEKCRCQCAPSHYTFREDMKQCIKDVGECPVAMFVRPFAVERIPLVFLPMTGQLVYPGAHLTVSGIARLAPSRHLSCNVKTSLLMTSHGWRPIRTPSHIFGVFYDGNKTFLQWLGDDEDRRRLQHHLVLIRLLCEGENSNGTFEPCAALRIGWAPGLEPEVAEPSTNKNNFIIIGLCLGILGLIYVGAVLIYLKVRKNRRQAARQGLTPSHTTIESADDEPNCTQLRNAYINNLVQEAEFTTKATTNHGSGTDIGKTSPDNPQSTDTSSSHGNSGIGNGKSCHAEKHTRMSTGVPEDTGQSPPQEFFVRIRGMIAAAKNRLNSFRYRPTLLVIPEDDYFYQDFKERDMEASGDRKSFRKLSRKGTPSTWANKMESIHGSNLGAAMLEAKLAPPLPPPRNARMKSKKRAPSPPGERSHLSDNMRDTPSPSISLKELGGSLDRKKLKSHTVTAESYSKFDLFRFDLYEKINRMRDGGRDTMVRSENDIAVLEVLDGKRPPTDEMYEKNSERVSQEDDAKISRRQLLHKLQETDSAPNSDNESSIQKSCHSQSDKDDEELDDDWLSSHAGSVMEEATANNAAYCSRPGTAMSNSSARTTSSQPSTMKENRCAARENKNVRLERDDRSECSETSEASLSGDSLNSSFRQPVKSPSSLKSKKSMHSTEDMSVISGSSVITSSTAIKEIEDYDEDDDDSRLSTDLDAEIYSLDESEHPSLEEYLQLSSQVAKKLSERTVPAFNSTSPKEKNVISQFMKEFKTTIGRLKTAEEAKTRSMRSVSPGSDNWMLKREEKRAKVARKVSIFKRNPLKGRKNEEPLVSEDSGKSGFYDINIVSETDDATSCTSSSASTISGKKGRVKYKNKTPEIVPAAKVIDTGEKTVISIGNDTAQARPVHNRDAIRYTPSPVAKIAVPRLSKAVTPPLPPPKPQLDQLKLRTAEAVRKKNKQKVAQPTHGTLNKPPHDKDKTTTILKNAINQSAPKTRVRYVRTPSVESDSISVANSDMTEDSLNTAVPEGESEDENAISEDSEDDNGPIDQCLAQLADSVIQPTDDCSLNRYLSQLGTVLATREDSPLDQCMNKLANNMNGNRATKGFNLSQHLPLCTWEHVCVDRGSSDRSTPTSDRSSVTSRGSQESLRKRTLTKSKHHHRPGECKHINGELPAAKLEHCSNHMMNGHASAAVANADTFATRIVVERSSNKLTHRSKLRQASTSEEEECGRASSLGSTREFETIMSETTSDPGSADLERPRKKRPLLRRSKKGLNGTCRQHIQNSRLNKKETGSLKKNGFQPRLSNTMQSSSSDVTVIQLEGDSVDHVTNVESSNTFVTLINVDSSDCSNSAEEK